jgi:hypothetical protein
MEEEETPDIPAREYTYLVGVPDDPFDGFCVVRHAPDGTDEQFIEGMGRELCESTVMILNTLTGLVIEMEDRLRGA